MMSRLCCRCLNVSIYYKGPTQPVSVQQLFPDGSRDRLTRDNLNEIELDVAGITFEQKSLVVARTIGDWVIHTCSNCDCDVYVQHAIKEESRTFVTSGLLSDPAAIQLLTQQESFSPIFKIALRQAPDDDDQGFQRKRMSSMSFGREDPVMKLVHAQMKSFLNLEQEAMENRIMHFENGQRDSFSRLQQRAHRDRALLFTAIARARENVISDAMKEAPIHLPPSPRPVMEEERLPRQPSPEQQRKVTITLQDGRPSKGKLVGQPPPMDDSMFALEGFDEEYDDTDGVPPSGGGVAFPQSDDEEISTDDSSYRDMSALNVPGIATSVPVGVPMFPRPPADQQLGSEGEDPFDPEGVANSIKALALSVQDTGMFGDLPKPRWNSSFHAR